MLHPWVSSDPATFASSMAPLQPAGCRVIARREVGKFLKAQPP